MEHGDSWDRPVPLAAPVLAGTETGAPVAYYDGIRAIARITGQFSRAAWSAPTPCPEWRAADLAGHLRCVADDYHEYLDDAPVSRLSRLMASGVEILVVVVGDAAQVAGDYHEYLDAAGHREEAG